MDLSLVKNLLGSHISGAYRGFQETGRLSKREAEEEDEYVDGINRENAEVLARLEADKGWLQLELTDGAIEERDSSLSASTASIFWNWPELGDLNANIARLAIDQPYVAPTSSVLLLPGFVQPAPGSLPRTAEPGLANNTLPDPNLTHQVSPSRSYLPFPQRDGGIRKKNARFNIPPERTLGNVDQLIANSTDDDEIKELKQQKRLLRNRQAAYDFFLLSRSKPSH
jgi:hypothetical protein